MMAQKNKRPASASLLNMERSPAVTLVLGRATLSMVRRRPIDPKVNRIEEWW